MIDTSPQPPPGPDPDPDEPIREAVKAIGEHARRANLERATTLVRALATAESGALDRAGRAAAADVAHQLVGSAGTFGFGDVSRLAVALERFFTAGSLSDRRQLADARERLRLIEEQLAERPDQRTA